MGLFRCKIAFVLIFVVVFTCFPVVAQAEDSFDNTPNIQVQAIPDTQGATVAAAAAIVIEAKTGRVLFEQSADERLPIASTTKIMTALMTLEQPDIDTQFVVDSGAVHVEGSSMGLQEGDVVTLRALAAGMLLPSGNDAANSAAVRIGGSIPEFVASMNRRAVQMGLENTSFETPSGLDGDAHYSSARDMASLASIALKNEDFAEICSQYKLRTTYGNPPYERWLTNHNKLLNYYEGTIGVKTGFTKKAGRCLVSAAERDGVTLIVVTLKCSNDWMIHRSLYDRYFGTLQVEDLAADIPATSVTVTGGTASSVDILHTDVAQIPVPVGGANVEYKIKAPRFVYAPVSKGQYIGDAGIYVDGVLVEEIPLTAASDVPLLHEYEDKPTFSEWLQEKFPALPFWDKE